MKTLIALAFVAFLTASMAIGQDAREITREMGADTTTSVSAGTDRNGVHRDTETALGSRPHAPSLLESVQGSKAKKSNKTEKKKLLEKRKLLLKERKASAEAAALAAKKAEGATEKARSFSAMSQESTVSEALARKKAEQAWDARRRKEVEEIDRALREESDDHAEVRLHAPSLVKPK